MFKILQKTWRLGRRYTSGLAKVSEDASSGPRVVVIGGGCAGLTAADRLLCAGIREVTVLEGTDRLGGRILSGWVGDTSVELGSEDIGPASITNPLFNLANQLGSDVTTPQLAQPVYVNVAEGRPITSVEPQRLLFEKILREVPPKSKIPLIQYIHLRVQQALVPLSEEQRKEWEPVLYGMTNRLRLEQFGEPLTLPAWTVYLRKGSSRRVVKLKPGNSCLMTTLATRIPFEKIKLSETVTKINWGECVNGVVIHTNKNNVYNADYVICTLPLGVLNELADDLFSPCLPDNKKEVMRSLNIATLDMVHLEYDEPWWLDTAMRLQLGWSFKELAQQGNWLKGIIEIRASSPTVISIKVAGAEARIIEEITDEEIGAEMTSLVRRLMRDGTIPYPRHVLVTRWGSNRYCRGSSAGLQLGADPDRLLELTKPIPADRPVVLFAGDGTVPEHLGTVVAARVSGIREADRILALAKNSPAAPNPSIQG